MRICINYLLRLDKSNKLPSYIVLNNVLHNLQHYFGHVSATACWFTKVLGYDSSIGQGSEVLSHRTRAEKNQMFE